MGSLEFMRDGMHFRSCGGAILSPTLVVSAAHCVKSKGGKDGGKDWFVAAGVHIKLKTPLKFTDGVQPICVPSVNEKFAKSKNMLSSGWGADSEASAKQGITQEKLHQLIVPFVPYEECKNIKAMKSKALPSVLCAGYVEGGKDVCSGDSGGPLAAMVNKKWTLAGVVSYGHGCGRKGQLGVYTNIASYADFINKHL